MGSVASLVWKARRGKLPSVHLLAEEKKTLQRGGERGGKTTSPRHAFSTALPSSPRDKKKGQKKKRKRKHRQLARREEAPEKKRKRFERAFLLRGKREIKKQAEGKKRKKTCPPHGRRKTSLAKKGLGRFLPARNCRFFTAKKEKEIKKKKPSPLVREVVSREKKKRNGGPREGEEEADQMHLAKGRVVSEAKWEGIREKRKSQPPSLSGGREGNRRGKQRGRTAPILKGRLGQPKKKKKEGRAKKG